MKMKVKKHKKRHRMNGMNMPHKLTTLFFKDFYKRFKMIKMDKTFRKMILIGMKLII